MTAAAGLFLFAILVSFARSRRRAAAPPPVVLDPQTFIARHRRRLRRAAAHAALLALTGCSPLGPVLKRTLIPQADGSWVVALLVKDAAADAPGPYVAREALALGERLGPACPVLVTVAGTLVSKEISAPPKGAEPGADLETTTEIGAVLVCAAGGAP